MQYGVYIIKWIYQTIKITKNKHEYRQSRGRVPSGSGVEWLNAGWSEGRAVEFIFFSLILDSSVGLSAGIQSAGYSVPSDPLGSNLAFIRGRQLVSFRFESRLPVLEHRN